MARKRFGAIAEPNGDVVFFFISLNDTILFAGAGRQVPISAQMREQWKLPQGTVWSSAIG
jgi:hypothetical protein